MLNEGENQITGPWHHKGSLYLNSEMESSTHKPSPVEDNPLHPTPKPFFFKFPLSVKGFVRPFPSALTSFQAITGAWQIPSLI